MAKFAFEVERRRVEQGGMSLHYSYDASTMVLFSVANFLGMNENGKFDEDEKLK